MTEQELYELRRQKWRLDGRGMRTVEEGREFLESVGSALMYPLKPPVLAPTFLGAYAGTDEDLPAPKHAFADPRAREATELMVRLLREKAIFEANVFGETNFLVSASAFPYLYGLAGDKHPRQMPKPGAHSEYSPLARDVFEAIRMHGAVSKPQLRELLGGEPSGPALDRALNELWSRLRITRVDYTPSEGAKWDALYRWAPDQVRAGIHISMPEALSALVSKYLEAVVAAEPAEVEEFFGRLVPKSRVREAINALLSARELSFVIVGKKTMLHVTPRREAVVPRVRRKA
jgi:23S rRNA pseudouridine2605 synthase